MATSLSQFRARFPEFSAIDDSVINLALSDAAAVMDVTRWDTRFDTGQAFLAAHYVSLSSTGSGQGGGSVGPVSQATTGPLSVSYAVPTALNGSEAMLGSTVYGQRYLELRNMVGLGGLVV